MSYKEPLDDELLLVHPTKLQAMGHFHGLLGRWFVGPWSIVGWLMANRLCFGLGALVARMETNTTINHRLTNYRPSKGVKKAKTIDHRLTNYRPKNHSFGLVDDELLLVDPTKLRACLLLGSHPPLLIFTAARRPLLRSVNE